MTPQEPTRNAEKKSMEYHRQILQSKIEEAK
jgi:hypothetical protein